MLPYCSYLRFPSPLGLYHSVRVMRRLFDTLYTDSQCQSASASQPNTFGRPRRSFSIVLYTYNGAHHDRNELLRVRELAQLEAACCDLRLADATQARSGYARNESELLSGAVENAASVVGGVSGRRASFRRGHRRVASRASALQPQTRRRVLSDSHGPCCLTATRLLPSLLVLVSPAYACLLSRRAPSTLR